MRRAEIEVVSAGLEEGPVTASRGTVLLPDTTLDAVLEQDFDMLVLPGGLPGSDHLDQDPRIHQLLKRMRDDGRYTAAICAAPKVLAGAGMLDQRRATAYPGVLDAYPMVHALGVPVVTDGKLITSRGPGTAMDFTLTLIEELVGLDVRERVEKALVRGDV